ncbi:MAG TPA: asparagine synthase (glutamine-hydrolyzing) [Deltaproteobacteria bacterium]|nr:asparagine synthase (glutamine-hydrolyzing) [Deltaproteobacteria bacterium]
MCGIAGIFDTAGRFPERDLLPTVEKMLNSISHRGPDGLETWKENNGSLVLGSARLSVVDLSNTGSQPMSSKCGRWQIVYNGELYNSREISKKLNSETRIVFRGHSDTEVLVESIAHWGVPETLKKIEGMFAFAAWDLQERELWIARDRFGEKPLYYGNINGFFVFTSELKTLRNISGFNANIDREALHKYFQYSYIPSPLTIFEEIKKLPQGHYLRIVDSSQEISTVKYWSPIDEISETYNSFASEDSFEEFAFVFEKAVHKRMISDVPLGAFLSGGTDSSGVVVAMQKNSSKPIKTFSIGFNEPGFDESPYAREVSKCIGTDHNEFVVSPKEAMEVIPKLPMIFDEPFADSSQIPMYLVSSLAKQKVTVALSGDGADEIFGGYERYKHLSKLAWLRNNLNPRTIRSLGKFINLIPASFLGGKYSDTSKLILPKVFKHRTSERIGKLKNVLLSDGSVDDYEILNSFWHEGNPSLASPTSENQIFFTNHTDGILNSLGVERHAMLKDMNSYLPDDLLVKADRASMAVSLEVRAPFLDLDLFRLAWASTGDFHGKDLLRKYLSGTVPDHLINRPKMGFGVPVGEWIRGPLLEWTQDLISPASLDKDGYIDSETVAKYWNDHISGESNFGAEIWSVLMFQAWKKDSNYGF